MKFINKSTGEIKEAHSIIETKSKFKIQFTKGGKEYWYSKDKISLIENTNFIIYTFDKPCFKCKNSTKIYTYIVYDNSIESLTFPWDKNRLNSLKSYEADLLHMQHENIEFYPITVLGSNSRLDKLLLDLYPKNIKYLYSYTQKRKYAMNVCEHCGSQQGEFFVYQDINIFIEQMKEIDIDKIVQI